MSDKQQGVDVDAELALLLREQEQFLQQKKQPAAKVSRRGSAPAVSSSHKAETASESNDAPQVLGQVVERTVSPQGQKSFNMIQERRPSAGFPAVKRRAPGQSLFGRRRREVQNATQPTVKGQTQYSEPVDQESRDIDAANKARLQEMSPQEILEAQQELLKSLDPQLIEKFKNRRKSPGKITERKSEKKKAPSEEKSVKSVVSEQRKVVVAGEAVVTEEEREEQRRLKEEEGRNLSAIKTEEQLRVQAQQLPPEERAKLDWTQSTQEKKHGQNAAAPSKKLKRPAMEEATLERFDLDGQVLQATDADVPVHSGLFHHGDDPESAGYTLPELLHLARSSVASQRAMALSVVAKILHKRQIQQNALLPVAPRVLPRDLAITLRIVLDDQNYTALSAGVSAMHAFIVPAAAASCLEDIFLPELRHGAVVLPPKVHLHRNGIAVQTQTKSCLSENEEVVYIDTSEADDGSSISDEDLAALDPVQALLNMDLETRLRFILETVQLPDQYATEKMLEILIAVARHSPRAAHEISSNARLMKLLQQQYIENEQVLTFQADNVRPLQFTLRALELVRVLCQGQRSVASALIANGLIQSTKGFLALKETVTDSDDKDAAALFARIQIESLRIWRVLLGYGLDFHCFAYLFPVLLGFVQKAPASSVGLAARTAALFAALESFCCLGALHEAQHYFNQLGFFVDVAKDEAVRELSNLASSSDIGSIVRLSTVLRFLAGASALAIKYNLETGGLQEVFKLVQSREVTQSLTSQVSDSVFKRDLLVAIVGFHQQVISAGLMPDDMDDEEIAQTFAHKVKAPLLVAANSAVALSSTTFSPTTIQACELTIMLGELIAAAEGQINAEFVQDVYHQALMLVEKLSGGGEYWIARLFASVLFHYSVLRSLGIFSDEADATQMSRVLVPIYQALVNATREQEAHSAQIFTRTSVVDKFSWHLRLPQEEQSYVPGNLPLPSFWMLSPLSRIEYSNNGADHSPPTDSSPTRAQSEEMKIIISATCRFVFEFERLAPQLVSISSITELQPEDKLFHLMHVFFAGSDVLFDDHVDAALRKLLPKLVDPILRSPEDSRLLYEGFLRNLKRFEGLETGVEPAPAPFSSSPSFSSDEQQVLTFVEKLMAEYTASSYGNTHFAQCVALLLTRDFPLMVRKFVWKELHDCRQLHTPTPFEVSNTQHFRRCTRGDMTPATDAQLLELMQQAVCKQVVSPTRGAFAYTLAIHHLAVYLFPVNSTLSFARQQFAQTLASAASPTIWGHLLSYDTAKNSSLLTEDHDLPIPERLEILRTQAGFSSDQLLAFETSVSLLGSSNTTE
ncbi:RNA polymerase II associated protein 1 [Phytophthora boehmeriae]|uniref:RNA polymerase II associated protein 1 n=1 Tax=Phytophthora boehmeriae TaxID=109152 RepID=A0A8T1WS60_9STRA|nr:RNA polymerase II associated protein 1 [Phytophthora boehmeriae]